MFKAFYILADFNQVSFLLGLGGFPEVVFLSNT